MTSDPALGPEKGYKISVMEEESGDKMKGGVTKGSGFGAS